MLKKFAISLFLALFLLTTIFVRFAKAQGTWYSQDFQQFYVTTFDANNSSEIFGERYTAAQVQWVLYSVPGHLLTSLTGGPELWICIFAQDATKCTEAIFNGVIDRINTILSFFGVNQEDLIPHLGQKKPDQNSSESLYGFFYNNPVSAVGMVLRGASKIHLVPEASAQGFGFNTGANTVLNIWKVARNIAFSFLVLIVVVMAFMIMFRVKISPQAVITLQSALPKIIVGIILIALSYAIAGLLIDLMYVVIGIISLVFTTVTPTGRIVDLSPKELFLDLTSHRNAFVLCLQYIMGFFIGFLFTLFSASWFGGILAFFVFLAVFVMGLINSVRILWVLIKTYINIILSIISAPFQILIGMIPGSTGGFGSWLKSMIANLAVFPTVGILFVLSFVFLAPALMINIDWIPLDFSQFVRGFLPFNPDPQLLPPQTSWDPPLLGWLGNGGKFLYLMISFGIFLMIPKAANLIKAFMEKKPFDYGSAIGEATGEAGGIARGATAGVISKYEDRYGPTTVGSILRTLNIIKK